MVNFFWRDSQASPSAFGNGKSGYITDRRIALRIRVADGPPQRILDKGQQHMPGEEAWRSSSGERKYYLSNLPATVGLKKLAAAVKARWVCEQAHQQMKEELGLDHFEGRSWQGLHRHALMTMIAYAFLQQQRLKEAKREKRILSGPPQPTLPAIRRTVIKALSRKQAFERCPRKEQGNFVISPMREVISERLYRKFRTLDSEFPGRQNRELNREWRDLNSMLRWISGNIRGCPFRASSNSACKMQIERVYRVVRIIARPIAPFPAIWQFDPAGGRIGGKRPLPEPEVLTPWRHSPNLDKT